MDLWGNTVNCSYNIASLILALNNNMNVTTDNDDTTADTNANTDTADTTSNCETTDTADTDDNADTTEITDTTGIFYHKYAADTLDPNNILHSQESFPLIMDLRDI